MPARTAPRIWVARPTAPTASAPSRPTISIEERPRTESSPNERITGHASAHTSKRMRSIGGRVIATPPPEVPTSGTASRNSDMIVNSYASTRRDSQCTSQLARERRKIVRAREIRYISRGDGQDNRGAQWTVAPAAWNLRSDLRRRRIYLFVPSWHRRARRERGLQRPRGGETGNRRDRSHSRAARSRQAGFLLRRAALLHADFRAERDFAALDVGDFFADDAGAGVRARR